MYTRHPTFVTAMSDVLTRLPVKLSKNGMRVKTSPRSEVENSIADLNGLRNKGVKQKRNSLWMALNLTL